MNGLDAHYSALWVENERRETAGEPTAMYTIRIAVEGFVEIDVEASSRSKAVDQALEIFDNAKLGIAVTDKSIEDVEKWK